MEKGKGKLEEPESGFVDEHANVGGVFFGSSSNTGNPQSISVEEVLEHAGDITDQPSTSQLHDTREIQISRSSLQSLLTQFRPSLRSLLAHSRPTLRSLLQFQDTLPENEWSRRSQAILQWFLATFGSAMIGFGLSTPGVVVSLSDFLDEAYRKFLHEMKYEKADYDCKYNSQIINIVAMLPIVSASGFRFMAPMFVERFGARDIMRISFSTFCIGAGTILVFPIAFIPASMLIGVGLGLNQMAIQIYLHETSSGDIRTLLDRVWSSSFSIGVVGAGVVSYLISKLDIMTWRWLFYLFGGGGVILILVCLLPIPNPKPIQTARPFFDILGFQYRPALTVSITSQIFGSLLGAAAISFYMPTVFSQLGLPRNYYFIYSIINGVSCLVGLGASDYLLRRFGRRNPLLMGTFVMIACMVVIEVLMHDYMRVEYRPDRSRSLFILTSMTLYNVGYTLCFGPVGWLSSAFPRELQWIGAVVSSNTNAVSGFLLSPFASSVFCALRSISFSVYITCGALMSAFVYVFVPETNGLSHADVQDRVWPGHWFWRKFMRRGPPI